MNAHDGWEFGYWRVDGVGKNHPAAIGYPRLREQSSKSLQRLAALPKHFDVLDPGNSPNTFRNAFCKHSGSLQNPSIEKTSILILIPSSFLSFSWRNISICWWLKHVNTPYQYIYELMVNHQPKGDFDSWLTIYIIHNIWFINVHDDEKQQPIINFHQPSIGGFPMTQPLISWTDV